MGKTVKPRTNLLLDLGLFSLALVHLTAALTVNVFLHNTGPTYQSWHRVLGFTGVSLALVVSVHLFFHLPWITVQLRSMVNRLKS
jgi:ABC-type Fe3+ transport system permease subunit